MAIYHPSGDAWWLLRGAPRELSVIKKGGKGSTKPTPKKKGLTRS